MKKNSLKKIVLGASIILALFIKPAFAEFSLSIRPYEGGYDLNFGKLGLGPAGVNQELTVNIRSDIGKQYRLIQSFFQPLTNAQGISIPLQNTCVFYALRGSSKFGTFSVEQETPVSFSRTIIYTSNSQGLSDNFTLVYSLRGPLQVPSGTYRGRIGFSLEAIDSTQPPATVFMNILCEVESAEYLEIKTADESKVIRLSSKNPESSKTEVSFNISSGLGDQYRIIQSIQEPLRSNEGEQPSENAVSFSISGARSGAGPNQLTPLALRPEVIYTSDPRGKPDNFVENFVLGELSGCKAGTYKTTLSYFLEGPRGQEQKRLGNYLLEVEVDKLFDMELKTESGDGTISFKDVGANQPPRDFGIEVRIKTNLGKSYMVTQRVLASLTSKDGKSIPEKDFTVRTESSNNTKGVLKCLQKTEVKAGDTTLFVSDKHGSSDTFKAIYELAASQGVKAGDYSATVVYSLSEL